MSAGAIAALVLVLAVAPALPGIVNRTRAILMGRQGPPVSQLYSELRRLWHKGVVYSRTTTPVFRAAPIFLCATTLLAAALLPFDGRTGLLSFRGDLVAFAGLLGLGRFLLVLASLDTGSSFEGMGAAREVTIASFTEPALFLCFAVLVLATGDLRLGGMLGEPLSRAWTGAAPSLVLASAGLFIVTLAESSRVPVDDPATHLELTMIHEVMVLDHSGPDYALILYAGAVKLSAFASLLTGALIPRAAFPLPVSLLVLVAGLVLVAVAIGVVESIMARLRMPRVSHLLVAASALAALALILVVS